MKYVIQRMNPVTMETEWLSWYFYAKELGGPALLRTGWTMDERRAGEFSKYEAETAAEITGGSAARREESGTTPASAFAALAERGLA